MDYSWALQSTLRFTSGTLAVLPAANWMPTTTFDQPVAAATNASVMNSAGLITLAPNPAGGYRVVLRVDPGETGFAGTVSMVYTPVSGSPAPYTIASMTIPQGATAPQYTIGRVPAAATSAGDTVRITWAPSVTLTTALPAPTVASSLTVTALMQIALPQPLHLIGTGTAPPTEAPLRPTFLHLTQTLTGTPAGQTIFYLTTNGAASGTTWFPLNYFMTHYTARLPNGGTITTTPNVTENTRDSVGNMWVQCNATVPLTISGTLLASGAQQTVGPAPAGTVVQLTAIGW